MNSGAGHFRGCAEESGQPNLMEMGESMGRYEQPAQRIRRLETEIEDLERETKSNAERLADMLDDYRKRIASGLDERLQPQQDLW